MDDDHVSEPWCTRLGIWTIIERRLKLYRNQARIVSAITNIYELRMRRVFLCKSLVHSAHPMGR